LEPDAEGVREVETDAEEVREVETDEGGLDVAERLPCTDTAVDALDAVKVQRVEAAGRDITVEAAEVTFHEDTAEALDPPQVKTDVGGI